MILNSEISYFKNTRDTEVAGSITISDFLKRIKDGTYATYVNKLRAGDKEAKLLLPTFAVHGKFEFSRKKDNFYEASGVIVLDIDNVEDDLEETKKDIMESFDSILACMVSPSGNGIKVLYYIEPNFITQDSYRPIGKELVSNFEVYGDVDYLSITDCLIATYDPNIMIAEEAIPDMIITKGVEIVLGELEPLDKSKTLWDNPEDFFDTVLYQDISEKTNNNFHFIQVSVFDMAKYGFKHPAEDLSFIIDYSEDLFKSSPSNKQRFLECCEIAKDYPQLQHPYKLYLEQDTVDDEYVDYSDFIEADDTSNGEDEESEFNGLIDYSNLWEKVLQTMQEGNRVGYEVSLKNLADALRFKGTGILTVTGIPGHGKTEFVDQILLDLARLYGHKSLIAGFEQSEDEHIVKLMRKMVGADIRCQSWRSNSDNLQIAKDNFEFVTNHFLHLDVNKMGGSVNDILTYAAQIVKEQRDNGADPKYMVIDPFNMLSIKGKFSGHEKIEEILRRITHFSHQMGILVFLVAHPFKMKKDEKTGYYEIPDFYSVKGSSAFFEMSYHGFVVYRNPDGTVLVKILKVKQNNLGSAGAECLFTYDKLSGRYIPEDEEGNELSGDHRERDWLNKFKTK